MNAHGVLIVGASLAGARAAQELRARGYEGPLRIVGEERRLPYNRPPLSKQLLTGQRTADELTLPGIEAIHADWLLGQRAVGLDAQRRRVSLEDGSSLRYDALILATGASPRRFQGPGSELAGAMTLRTLEDAVRLRDALQHARHLTVVGGGFIGAEVAASARALGVAVTLVELADGLMQRALGPALAAWYVRLHEGHGVHVRTGCAVRGLVGRQGVERIRLSDGSTVDTDLVVLGLGTEPRTDWLAASGLPLDNGVRVGPDLSVPGTRIFAAGDLANVEYPLYGRAIRIEHWQTATEQGTLAAANLLTSVEQRAAYGALPSFWSDQYDAKLRSIGVPALADTHAVSAGSLESGSFVVSYTRRRRLVGAVAVNARRELEALRPKLAAEAALVGDALEAPAAHGALSGGVAR